MMELFTITLWVPQTIHSANKNFIFLFRTDISAQFLWSRTAVFEIFAWSLGTLRWFLRKILRIRSKIRNWKIWKCWASSWFFGLLSGDAPERSRQPKDHVILWASCAPQHHTLPAFLNLNDSKFWFWISNIELPLKIIKTYVI